MLLYIAVGLATVRRGTPLRWGALVQRSRALLGLGGVAVVGASSAGALGLAGWAGLPATLIVLEVIPFLVLASELVWAASQLAWAPLPLPLPLHADFAPSMHAASRAASSTAVIFAYGEQRGGRRRPRRRWPSHNTQTLT